jgi:hypothetical protein
MSLFDDNDEEDFYYDPNNEFQRRALKHAERDDEHPLVYMARTMDKALEAIDDFANQDPLLSKRERIAISSDIEEAEDALLRACKVIPEEVTQEDEQ